MANQELINYINHCLKSGYNKELVRRRLFIAGWSDEQILEALEFFKVKKEPDLIIPFSREKILKPNNYLRLLIALNSALALLLIVLIFGQSINQKILSLQTAWLANKEQSHLSQIQINKPLPIDYFKKVSFCASVNNQSLADFNLDNPASFNSLSPEVKNCLKFFGINQ